MPSLFSEPKTGTALAAPVNCYRKSEAEPPPTMCACSTVLALAQLVAVVRSNTNYWSTFAVSQILTLVELAAGLSNTGHMLTQFLIVRSIKLVSKVN